MSEKNLRINVMNLHVEHNVSIVKWRMHSTLITVTCLASHAATKSCNKVLFSQVHVTTEFCIRRYLYGKLKIYNKNIFR